MILCSWGAFLFNFALILPLLNHDLILSTLSVIINFAFYAMNFKKGRFDRNGALHIILKWLIATDVAILISLDKIKIRGTLLESILRVYKSTIIALAIINGLFIIYAGIMYLRAPRESDEKENMIKNVPKNSDA